MTMLRSEARSIPIPSSSPATARADDEREREMRELSQKKVAEIQGEHAEIHEKGTKMAALRERIRVLEKQEPERTLRERLRALETQVLVQVSAPLWKPQKRPTRKQKRPSLLLPCRSLLWI
jgi:hypothetical protein